MADESEARAAYNKLSLYLRVRMMRPYPKERESIRGASRGLYGEGRFCTLFLDKVWRKFLGLSSYPIMATPRKELQAQKDGHKVCRECLEEKPFDCFHPAGRGYRKECKDCRSYLMSMGYRKINKGGKLVPPKGRAKTKWSPGLQKKIVAHIKKGNRPSTAAAREGISVSTLQRWMQQGKAEIPPYDQFYLAIQKADAEKEMHFVEQLRGLADGTLSNLGLDRKAIEFFLERQFKDGWGKTVTHQHEIDITERLLDRVELHMSEPAYAELLDAIAIEQGRVTKQFAFMDDPPELEADFKTNDSAIDAEFEEIKEGD